MRLGGLGSEKSRVALFVLVTISCGATASRGQKSDGAASGAVGGSSTATAGAVASEAGATISNPQGGVPTTNSAGASGGEPPQPEEASQSGAGGGSASDGDYRFEIIPTLDPKGPARAGVFYSAQWVSASADGAVLAGFASVYDDATVYSPSGMRFLWTADGKTEPMPSGSLESGLFDGWALSADGTSLFGYVRKLEITSPTSSSSGPVSFFRWTRAKGDVRFGPPEALYAGQLELISADGTTALGEVQRTTDDSPRFRWTEANGFTYLSELGWPPDATYAAISSNGEVIAGNRDPAQAFIWSEKNHFVALEAPPGFPYCFVESLSPDGSVALGSCMDETATTTTTFRWTAADGVVDLGVPGYADSTSDGRVAVGTDGQAVYRWTEGEPTLELEPPASWAAGTRYSISLKGESLSQDGSTFGGRFYLDFDSPEPPSFPFLWNEEEGFIRLELLPGLSHGAIADQTADGSVQLGSCWAEKGTPAEAVLWDSHGVRQLSRELSEAGIDLQGMQLSRVSYLSGSDSTLMVAGGGKAKDGNGNAWLAWLPKRP